MEHSMLLCLFCVFDRKYTFWGNLVQKIKNCCFKVKFGIYSCKFEYPEFSGLHFLSFKPEIHFLGKFGKKKQNYLCKLKFVRLIGVYKIQL